MDSAAQAHSWQPNDLSFNLQPQQPVRVRKGWERVPVKAATGQQKERKVWKRPEAKEFQYETEHGGAGFAINGAKRVRTQNVPALPMKKSVRRDRAIEADAEDDLYARRRKSARLSSLNLQKLASTTSPTKRRSEARRTLKTRDSLRSPLKDLRVMALTQNAQSRKPESSHSDIQQDDTPMRKILGETQFGQSKTSKGRLSIGGVLGSGTPMRMAFAEQENQVPIEESNKLEEPERLQASTFGSPLLQMNVQDSNMQDQDQQTTPRRPAKRRSLRLSGQRESLEGASKPLQPAVQLQKDAIQVEETDTSVLEGPTQATQEESKEEKNLSQEGNPAKLNEDAENQLISEMKIAFDDLEATNKAAVKDGPKEDKLATPAELSEKMETEEETNTASPYQTNDCVNTPASQETPDAAQCTISSEDLPAQENVLSVLQAMLGEDDVAAEYDSDNMSEDELADGTTTQLFPFGGDMAGPETTSPRRRSTPRLSDDTSILKDFLNRAQAKRAAQAQAAQLLSAKLGPSIQLSPRRSPRRAAASTSKETSPLKKAPARPAPGPSTTAVPAGAQDGDESDELCSPTKVTRRSARSRPAPSKAGMGAPSMIPLRRPNGQEPVKLKQTESQQVAMATRTNTRRNQGQAKMPREMLEDLCKKELSPIKSRGERRAGKAVDWQGELVSYLGEKADKNGAGKGAKQKRSKGLGTANGTPAKPAAARSASGSSTPARRLRSGQS